MKRSLTPRIAAVLLAVAVFSSVTWLWSAYDPNSPARTHNALTDLDQIRENTNQLRKNEAGAAEPANLVPGMQWFDTSADILRLRNEANSAWQDLWDFASNRLAGTNVVVEGNIASGAVTNGKIGAGAVSHDKLAAGTAIANIGAGGLTEPYVGASAVSQGKLKTSTAEVSAIGSAQNRTLSGGEYGFYPQLHSGAAQGTISASFANASVIGTSYVTNIWIDGTISNAYARQRYVTSSGEVFWVFLLFDRATGKLIGSSAAPDHPCMGNGGDPEKVPHPFPDFNPARHEIVVVNPTDEEVLAMMSRAKALGKSLLQAINEDYEIEGRTVTADSETGKVSITWDEKVSEPAWPARAVTVGLPEGHDWKRDPDGTPVTPIKAVIPRPDNVRTAKLRLKEER